MSRYDDMLDLERPRHENDEFSRRHPAMPLEERAKIFLPFAALKGFEEIVAEREVRYVRESGVSDDLLGELNQEMLNIEAALRNGLKPTIRVKIFLTDTRAGEGMGQEGWMEDTVEKIDRAKQSLKLSGREIPFSALREIQIMES